MYKIAILGCENTHANSFLRQIYKKGRHTDIEVIGIYSEEEEPCRKLHEEFGVTLAFVTLGPKGCYYSNGREAGEVETPKGLNVVDTTGAGDIFGGSVLSRILACGKPIGEITGGELRAMTRFACCAASLSTQRSGGISSVVPMEDVLAAVQA